MESIFGKQQVKNTPARSPKKSSPRGGRDGVEERVAFMAKL